MYKFIKDYSYSDMAYYVLVVLALFSKNLQCQLRLLLLLFLFTLLFYS